MTASVQSISFDF